MPARKRPSPATGQRAAHPPATAVVPDAAAVLELLRQRASAKYRAGMSRFAIPSTHALGVPVGEIRTLGRRLTGTRRQAIERADANHALAESLWRTGVYEARLLTAFVDHRTLVTAAQMNRWARDFDSWALCDTLCFHLFDRTPLAWAKVRQWSGRREEFVRRAAFALLASLALHDKAAADDRFLELMPLIPQAAGDERNFVKKAVNWALRAIGTRTPALHAAALAMSRELAGSTDATRRWIGRGALRELERKAARWRGVRQP